MPTLRASTLTVLLACGGCLATAEVAQAQNTSQPETTQRRPDARYPNPSGQDSNPSTTTVKPTKPAPSTKTPQNSTTGQASKQTYNDGKKRDAAGGCSTPTDAKSAHDNKDKKPTDAADKTVCTTTGENSQSEKKPQP